MKHYLKLILIMMLSGILPMQLFAVPKKIAVQGMLKTGKGIPVNGEFTIGFFLYENAEDVEGETEFFKQEFNEYSVNNGLLNAVLSFDGTDTEIFKKDLFLSFKLKETPQSEFIEIARVPLTSVAYAFFAGSAGSCGECADLKGNAKGLDCTGCITGKEIADNAVGGSEIAPAAVSFKNISDNGCKQGEVIKFNGSEWICAKDEDSLYAEGTGISISSEGIISAKFGISEGMAAEGNHNHDAAYSATGHNHNDLYSAVGHNHNTAYYEKNSIDQMLSGKSGTGHNHDGSYSKTDHNHDSLYYGKGYVDGQLSLKSDAAHNHNDVYPMIGHNHDSVYFQQGYITTQLDLKSDASHNHDSSYAKPVHNHDSLYYGQGYIDGQLSLKSDTGHNHNDSYSVLGHNHDALYFGKDYVTNQLALKSDYEHNHDSEYVIKNDENSITGLMILDGTVKDTDIADNAIKSKHIDDYTIADEDIALNAEISPLKISGTGATLTGDQKFDNGTLQIDSSDNRVGINTQTPEDTLDVNGNAIIRGNTVLKGNILLSGKTVDMLREEIVFDSDWFPYPVYTALSIAHGIGSEPDFVFGLAKGYSGNHGEVISPIMGSSTDKVNPAYVKLDGTGIGLNGKNALIYAGIPGDATTLYIDEGSVLLRAFKKTPTWSSGWQAISVSDLKSITPTMNSFAHFAFLEISLNSDGSGWRVPAMSSATYDTQNYQTSIISLGLNHVTVKAGDNLAKFRDISGTIQTPASGYFRILLYNWSPDYDSGWISISTTAGDRDKWIKHDLGKMPSLMMLYVSQENNDDSTGWRLPAMSAYQENYSKGTVIYFVNKTWAVIKGGKDAIASFKDYTGTTKTPTSGYIRFMAWY
jgi:hypothetical protein